MAQLKVLATNSVRGVLPDMLPGFEAATGHTVLVVWLTTKQTMARLREGESADVVIGTDEGIQQLRQHGNVVANSIVPLGSTAIGVAVRRGAPKPDIGTTEALKRALIDAKSVTWTTMGASGVHFEAVLDRLGIAGQVKAKSKAIVIPGGLIGELLARDEAALGIQMVSEILAVPGCELVAPLPANLQKKTLFVAAVLTGSGDKDAARNLIAYLRTPDAARMLKSKGFDAP